LLLTADTVVALGGKVLGKPNDAQDACHILGELSGKMHNVITAICLWNLKTDEWVTASEVTKVQFRQLSPEEIQTFVETGEPLDKAGAYGIQGLGRNLVVSFNGDFLNVVGLPLTLFGQILEQKGWDVARAKT